VPLLVVHLSEIIPLLPPLTTTSPVTYLQRKRDKYFYIFLLLLSCKLCVILNVRKACCTMFLYNGFRLGVRRAMAHTLTLLHSILPSSRRLLLATSRFTNNAFYKVAILSLPPIVSASDFPAPLLPQDPKMRGPVKKLQTVANPLRIGFAKFSSHICAGGCLLSPFTTPHQSI